MTDYTLLKRISFKCSHCQNTAKIVESDGRIETVECLPCGIALNGEDARLMYNELIVKYRNQEGRNIMRREIRKMGMSRVPLTQVDDEFSDTRWPFILVIKGDA